MRSCPLSRVEDQLRAAEEGQGSAAFCVGDSSVPDLRRATAVDQPRLAPYDAGALGAEEVALQLDGGEALR